MFFVPENNITSTTSSFEVKSPAFIGFGAQLPKPDVDLVFDCVFSR